MQWIRLVQNQIFVPYYTFPHGCPEEDVTDWHWNGPWGALIFFTSPYKQGCECVKPFQGHLLNKKPESWEFFLSELVWTYSLSSILKTILGAEEMV